MCPLQLSRVEAREAAGQVLSPLAPAVTVAATLTAAAGAAAAAAAAVVPLRVVSRSGVKAVGPGAAQRVTVACPAAVAPARRMRPCRPALLTALRMR